MKIIIAVNVAEGYVSALESADIFVDFTRVVLGKVVDPTVATHRFDTMSVA